MLWSKNNINIFNSAIVGIAMFCGSCINGLYAQDKIKVDVYANLYLSGSATIGNVLEELVVGSICRIIHLLAHVLCILVWKELFMAERSTIRT